MSLPKATQRVEFQKGDATQICTGTVHALPWRHWQQPTRHKSLREQLPPPASLPQTHHSDGNKTFILSRLHSPQTAPTKQSSVSVPPRSLGTEQQGRRVALCQASPPPGQRQWGSPPGEGAQACNSRSTKCGQIQSKLNPRRRWQGGQIQPFE